MFQAKDVDLSSAHNPLAPDSSAENFKIGSEIFYDMSGIKIFILPFEQEPWMKMPLRGHHGWSFHERNNLNFGRRTAKNPLDPDYHVLLCVLGC